VFLVLLGLLAAFLSWFGVRLTRGYAIQRQVSGVPASTARSELPRGGGIVILVITLLIFMPAGIAVADPGQVVRFALCAAMIATVSFFDDLRTLPRLVRLAAQSLAALIFIPAAPIYVIGLPHQDLLLGDAAAYVVSVLWIVGLSNAYSYMDGIDGLAGGQAVLVGGLWAGVGLIDGNMLVLLLGVLVAGASAGFLVYNLPPASIFMGEVGGTFLGFCLAALPMFAVAQGGSSRLIVAGGMFVSLFVFDAALTFFRYLMKGDARRTFRSHLYQRLVRLGDPAYRVTLLYLSLSVGLSVAGIVYWQSAAWMVLSWPR
jgi:UDP-N-acetylmuramyl pentapeptide phosphotransferase/UDP-N-acetylglucosamine-1-phosphate transferase